MAAPRISFGQKVENVGGRLLSGRLFQNLRTVNIINTAPRGIGSRGGLFETTPGRVVKVLRDCYQEEVGHAQLLSDLGVGPQVYGLVQLNGRLPRIVNPQDSTDVRYFTKNPLAYEMEYLDPNQGWVDQDSQQLRELDQRIAQRIKTDLEQKQAILLRHGFDRADARFMVNTRTGEVKVVDASRAVKQTEKPSATQRLSISQNPQTFVEHVVSDLIAGRFSRWLVINFSGLKYVNDKLAGGHRAGDAYLRVAEQALRRIVGEDKFVVRDGPNFSVHLAEGVNEQALLAALQAEFGEGINFGCEAEGQQVEHSYTAETEGRQSIYNPGIISFDPALVNGEEVTLSAEAIGRSRALQIYYLNRPEEPGYEQRLNKNFTIGLEQAEWLNSFTRENRSLDVYDRVTHTGKNVEPRSKLYNVHQLRQDGAEILSRGGSVRLAFLDGNAFGSFRSVGLGGEIMMDTVVEQIIPEAALLLEQRGITIYRHGSMSEEFYFLADAARVSEAEMQQALMDFMLELNKNRHRIKVFEGEVKGEAGELDIREVVRTDPQGRTHKGLTITAGFGTINSEPNQSAAAVFNRISQQIIAFGEQAKDINPERLNLLVQVENNAMKPVPLPLPIRDPVPTDERSAGRKFLRENAQRVHMIDNGQGFSRFTPQDLIEHNLEPRITLNYRLK